MATKMTISLLPEPELEFRYGQKMHDPHTGLALFGPYDADAPSHPKSLVYGVIGAPEGVAAFQSWGALLQDPIVKRADEPEMKRIRQKVKIDERKLYLLWPPFPGFEAGFAATWPTMPAWKHELDRDTLLNLARDKDANKRAYDVVNLYCDGLRRAKERDEAFSVIVCIVPEEVWQNCRPLSKVKDGHGRGLMASERATRRVQGDLFGHYDPEEYELSVDFRRQLKARAMEFGIPLQIVRESTLRIGPPTEENPRNLTPESDRAWNLSTTLYYKAGGKPWRLSTAREGVCYIGLAFRRTDDVQKPSTACCAAQMFLDTGDGIVFRGEFGPWYSPERKQYHLDKNSARTLLSGVLKAYKEQGGQKLTEVFLHSRSTLNGEEFEGYQEACPPGVKVVGVRVRTDVNGVKMFRRGKWPVLRGTLWKLNSRSAYLWASGFKPTVLSYDGWEVPNPLRIDIEHGEADIEQVAKDIFGLTKLNYNTCKLGDTRPVTVGFSDAVGEILVSNPTVSKMSPSFKFYI
jgi:hypothetical protein